MDVDEQVPSAIVTNPGLEERVGQPLLDIQQPLQSREQSAFDGSFHSAKEDLTREVSKLPSNSHVNRAVSPLPQAPQETESSSKPYSPQLEQTEKSNGPEVDSEMADKASLMDEDIGNDSLRSPSDGSSPGVKGLVRKSSLTFATLPAREPLTTKKSIGARLSRTSHVEAAKGVMSRGSFLGRITGGKSLGGPRQPEASTESHDKDEVDIDDNAGFRIGHEEYDGEAKAAKLHNKSSTQRLHDRINMLGKSQPARPTKSIPAVSAPSIPLYPELPLAPTTSNNAQRSSREDEDEDDWIQPPSTQTTQSPRPQLSKSISADVMENLRGKANIGDEQFGQDTNGQQQSPRRHSLDSERDSSAVGISKQAASGAVGSSPKAVRASHGVPSTTPLGTPIFARHADGPISASKSKLQSIMKTARGLFTSSAGASAQAKMELRNQAKFGSPNIPSPSRSSVKDADAELYPSLLVDQNKNVLPAVPPENPAEPPEGRRTRGSIEKEKKEKEHQRADQDLERLKEKENLGSNEEQPHRDRYTASDEQEVSVHPPEPQQQPVRKSPRRVQNQQDAASAPENVNENAQNTVAVKSSQPSSTSHQSQLQKPQNVKRPVKPAKETAPKPEPQRVAIRVGTLSQRIPLSNAALSSGLQDSLPPPPSKQPGLTKKTSIASIQTSGSNSNLRSATTSKPKALIAAEKKKEQVSLLLIILCHGT